MSMEPVQASWSCGCEETATKIVAVMKERSWIVGVGLPPGLKGSCAAKDRWDSSASPGSGGVSWMESSTRAGLQEQLCLETGSGAGSV